MATQIAPRGLGARATRRHGEAVSSPRAAKLTVAILLASCAGSLREPIYSSPPNGAYAEVSFAPPPARVELVPSRPENARAVWIDGEWDWTGTRWAWQYGRWVLPPPGATYSKWSTKRRADGVLLFAPGAWRSRSGSELPDPPPVAVARAADEGIIDAEGKTERTAPNESPEGDAPRAR